MKIIDKTPLQDENGEIGFISRIQGTLKYGMNWFADMQAQKSVVAQLDRMIEKGFVLIRNFTLPNSEIVIPIILLGPGGVFVISITAVKGFFEAKGDQWNTVSGGGNSQPASINLLGRLTQLTRAFQKYLEIHHIELSIPVESVLITADPGAHVDSVRPVARVVMSDAIKQFASSLLQVHPVLPSSSVYDLADRIINPQAREASAPPPAADTDLSQQQPISRAQAIFNASSEAKPFDPHDLGFAFEEEGGAETDMPQAAQPQAVQSPVPAASAQPKKKRAPRLSTAQIALLVGMVLVECCVLAGFFYLIFTNQ